MEEVPVVTTLASPPAASTRRHRRAPSDRTSARRPALTITTFGGFVVERDGVALGAVDFERQRARALLAALLCAGEPVHRERLLEWFWPALSPERGVAALHTTLHALRRALQPSLSTGSESAFVVRHGESYGLHLGEIDSCDLAQVLAAARDAAVLSVGDPVRHMEFAEARCRHSFLPEWPYEEWTLALRAEIEDASRALTERIAAVHLAGGRTGPAVIRYRRLLELEPERESLHRAIMRAYLCDGEAGLALRQYEACRKALAALGSRPGRETRDLHLEVLRRSEAP